MKKRVISSVLFLACLLCLLFTVNTASNASGNRSGRMYADNGSGTAWATKSNMSTTEVTTAMSPNGTLYNMDGKSVALISADEYCSVDRVRVFPIFCDEVNITVGDLRIDPNYSSNGVGQSMYNSPKQVLGVQTILYSIGGYTLTDDPDTSPYGMDGVCGQKTIDAIKAFQGDHNLTQDGKIGVNGWRALCSSISFSYGNSIW